MATWKKIVVSGSNISQLSNDAGYLTTGTLGAKNAFSTASYNGTSIISDSTTGSLNFASSSGQGLTISANATTDTLTFGLYSIPNNSLAFNSITIAGNNTALGGTVTQAQILAGSGAVSGSAQITPLLPAGTVSGSSQVSYTGLSNIPVGIVSGSSQVAALLPVGTVSGSSQVSGSIFSQVSGDITITTNGLATIQANSVALGTDTTGDYVANLGAGTGVTIGSNSGEGSAPTIAVNYGSSANTAVQGSTTISLTGTANEVEITGTTAQALGGGPSYTIGLPNDVTIGRDLTVTRNLTVFGTASFQHTSNLEVADRFVLLASGSNTNGDGGIVVQQDTQNVGELFGWDSGESRWAVTGSFVANQGAFAPDAFMAAAINLSSTNPNTTGPDIKYNKKGNIYVSTVNEDIWIYS